jgi:hypothetical protein
MSDKKPIDILALIEQETPITEAIRQGTFEAMKRHIAGNVPMVSFRDGQIIHISPEELKEMLKDAVDNASSPEVK